MRTARLAVVVLAALLLVLGTAKALTIRADGFVLRGDAGFTPTTLPHSENAPLAVHTSFRISLASGRTPPILNTITFMFDRHGKVDTTGLSHCRKSRLRGTTVRAARRACSSSIVGRGTATAIIEFPEQSAFSASSPITLFNGPTVGGEPTLLVHAYASEPVPTTFIVPVVVERIRKGVYGFRAEARIPPIANGYGHLISLSFQVGRKWMHRHRLHSYVNGRCENGSLQARVHFAFADERALSGAVSQPCTARH